MAERSRPRIPARRRTGGEGQPEVFTADEQVEVPIDAARWTALAEAVIVAEGIRGHAELSLLFVDEADIADLNEQFMHKAEPTDVLAFPIDASEAEIYTGALSPSTGPDRAPIDPSDLPLLLGDVVVCPLVAQRQAPEHAGTLDDELALLVVHGVLHVLGYDHAEPDDTARMRARELELLEAHHWRGPAPTAFRQEQA